MSTSLDPGELKSLSDALEEVASFAHRLDLIRGVASGSFILDVVNNPKPQLQKFKDICALSRSCSEAKVVINALQDIDARQGNTLNTTSPPNPLNLLGPRRIEDVINREILASSI
jgi:hypothetical protein